MFPVGNEAVKTTSYKVVIPFYLFAAFSFFVAALLLLLSSSNFIGHYFQPHTLAITHLMALGWGTMIIFGASHQLVPVIIEGRLYSEKLAGLAFVVAAIGIPLLIYGFYSFDLTLTAIVGGWLVVLAVLIYVVNLAISITKSNSENVQAIFAFTAALWLLLTVSFGLMLLYNFRHSFLDKDSLHYLQLHAHFGILGWFFLMVIGVGSRLIPMFLISKYTNTKLLWIIYILINAALLSYSFLFLYIHNALLILLPSALLLSSILLFGYYCLKAVKHRLRKQIDQQVRTSLLSVILMIAPVLLIIGVIIFYHLFSRIQMPEILAYGFLTFFGWITAIILGMTFKTFPFIIWNKVYHIRSSKGKTPSPKDLFSQPVYYAMSVTYVAGFIVFLTGIFLAISWLLQIGAALLLITAILFNFNVLKVFFHKPKVQ